MPEPFDSELTPLEASLARLVPRAEGLSRERMLFEAGRDSARHGRLWPALAALSSLATLVLAGMLLTRTPTGIVEERIVVRVKEAPAATPAPTTVPIEEPVEAPVRGTLPKNDYLRERERILLWGLEELPPLESSAATEAPLTASDLRAHEPPRSVLSLLLEKPFRRENVP